MNQKSGNRGWTDSTWKALREETLEETRAQLFEELVTKDGGFWGEEGTLPEYVSGTVKYLTDGLGDERCDREGIASDILFLLYKRAAMIEFPTAYIWGCARVLLRRELRLSPAHDELDELAVAASSADLPVEEKGAAIDVAAEEQRIREAVEKIKMPSKLREVTNVWVVQGVDDYNKLATILGITSSTARKRVERMRAVIKKHLERPPEEPPPFPE